MLPGPKLCPPRIQQTIDDYVNKGYPPGSFLMMVLLNHLSDAVFRADKISMENLGPIVAYVYENVPIEIRGESHAIHRHIEKFEQARKAVK